MWKIIFEKLRKPSKGILIVTYILTVLCIAWALTMLVLTQNHSNLALEIVSYVSYAFAALTLAYTVYTLIKVLPNMIRNVKSALREHPWTGPLMKNYGFRTIIFATGSMLLTTAFGIYNGAIAITRFMPVWYGALATYYISLACMRGGILLYHGKRYRKKTERHEMTEIKKYRNSGIVLCALITTLSAAIVQMVQADAAFDKPGLMIYVAAAYTFVKVTMAIVNFFKAKKQDDVTVEALRCVSAADAAVSILALQTAMFHSFATGADVGLFNAMTGAAVCAVVLTLGIFMIVKGNKRLKQIKEEENHVGE